jgi:hypothetical protein
VQHPDDFLMALVVKLDVWPAIILFYAIDQNELVTDCKQIKKN